MRKDKALKPFPTFTSDEEAERFVDTADLSDYDFSDFRPAKLETMFKEARVNLRLPTPLLDAVKAEAARQGIPYSRFIRTALEQAVRA